jgi:hypothetical protein
MIPRSSLLSQIPKGLRDPLFAEYDSIIQNYLESKWSPTELSAGKFCEIVFTIVANYVSGAYPNKPTKPQSFVTACRALESQAGLPRSFQILIPRLLPALYEVRNNRGVGHIGGDVDPNAMDSSLVVSSVKWILAELIRVLHRLSVHEAQEVVNDLAEITIPLVWTHNGKKRVLNTKTTLKEQVLILSASTVGGCTKENLEEWIEPENKAYLNKTIRALHKERLLEFMESTGHVKVLPPGVALIAQFLKK